MQDGVRQLRRLRGELCIWHCVGVSSLLVGGNACLGGVSLCYDGGMCRNGGQAGGGIVVRHFVGSSYRGISREIM
jgi:hypothetical protein